MFLNVFHQAGFINRVYARIKGCGLCVVAGLFIFLFSGTDTYAQQEDLSNGFIQYIWKQEYYAYLNGVKSLFFSARMPYAKIAPADIDEDGDMDLFIGTGDGTLAYVENTGTSNQPDLTLINRYVTFMDADDQIRIIQFPGPVSPALLDYDNDGDLDLFILDFQSTVHLFINFGTRKNPYFRIASENYLKIRGGQAVSITFSDINGDNIRDLAYGTNDGTLAYIPNSGNINLAEFNGKPQLLLKLNNQQFLSPAFVDWDKDGKTDVFTGSLTGNLQFFKNIGTAKSPRFLTDTAAFNYESDIYGFAAPALVDLNGDGNEDLLVGNITDKIRYYENRTDSKGVNAIWNITDNLLNFYSPINAGTRSSVVIKDVNGDGVPDLLTGENNGQLNLFINQNPNKKVPNFYQVSYDLLPNLKNQRGIPELGDLNGDGYPDILLCGNNGQLTYLTHNRNKNQPGWDVKAYNFLNISGNKPCAARLVDFDQDGDLDMFLSTADGIIKYYKNVGDKFIPNMIEADFPYGSEKYPGFPIPAFIDWRKNGVMSMLLGDPNGELNIVYDPLRSEYAEILKTLNKTDAANLSLYSRHTPEKLLRTPFLNDSGPIIPYVTDFDDDGAPDIIYGTEKGNITYLRNIGYEFYKEIPKVTLPVYKDLPPIFDNGRVLLKTASKRLAVAVGDIDGDGDIDIVMGDQKGDLYWAQNNGNRFVPKFSDNSIFLFLKTGLKNAAPTLYDLDNDGDIDIIVGTESGELLLYENTGDAAKFNYTQIKGVFRNFRVSKNAVPSVYRNSGNTVTLITGDLLGRLNLISGFKNNRNMWQFTLENRISLNTDVGLGASPFIGDMNIDSIPEIIIGSDSGRLTVLKSEGPFLADGFKTQNDYLPQVSFPEGTFPALADFDGDKDMDLIVGTQNGTVLYFTNTAIND